jgi:hypothetical protein
MVADFYVNVSGRKVLYSSLDPRIQDRLAASGQAQKEADRQKVKSDRQVQREYLEKDHIVKDEKGKEVSVPGRFAKAYGIAPPKTVKVRKQTRKEKIAQKKKEKQEKGFYLNVQDERGETRFEDLTGSEQRRVLRSVHPIGLAKEGILAPSESIHFRTKQVTKVGRGGGDNVIRSVHSPTLEKNLKSYLLTGDTQGINRYLEEVLRTQGAREAFKQREELIRMGVKGTALEGARQAGGIGTREQRLKKESEQEIRFQKVKGLMVKEKLIDAPILGKLGSTFDERIDIPGRLIETIKIDGKEERLDPSGKAVIKLATRVTTPGLISPELFRQSLKEKGITLTEQGKKLISLYTTQPEKFSFIRSSKITDPKTGKTFDTLTGRGDTKIGKALGYTFDQNLERPISPKLIPTGKESAGEYKLPLAKAIESSEDFLTKLAIEKQKFLADKPYLGIVDVLAVPVEGARIGLQVIGGIESTKEELISPLFGAKPAAPITFTKTTSDEVVFPVDFNTFTLKDPKRIERESRQYIETFGGQAFVGGIALSYGVGVGALVKRGAKVVTSPFQKIRDISKIRKELTSVIEPPKISITEKFRAPFEFVSKTPEFAKPQKVIEDIRFTQKVFKPAEVRVTKVKGAERLYQLEPTVKKSDKFVFAKFEGKKLKVFEVLASPVTPPKTIKVLTSPTDKLLAESKKFGLKKTDEPGVFEAKGKSVGETLGAFGEKGISEIARVREFTPKQIRTSPKDFARFLFQEGTSSGELPSQPLLYARPERIRAAVDIIPSKTVGSRYGKLLESKEITPISDVLFGRTASAEKFGIASKTLGTKPLSDVKKTVIRGLLHLRKPEIFKPYTTKKVSIITGKKIKGSVETFTTKRPTDPIVSDLTKHAKEVDPFFDASKFAKAIRGKTKSGKPHTPFPTTSITDDVSYPGKQIIKLKTDTAKEVIKVQTKPRDILTSKPRALPFSVGTTLEEEILSYPKTETSKLIASRIGRVTKPKASEIQLSRSSIQTKTKSFQSPKQKSLQESLLKTKVTTRQKGLTKLDTGERYKIVPKLKGGLKLVTPQKTRTVTIPKLVQTPKQKTRIITVPKLTQTPIVTEKLITPPPPKIPTKTRLPPPVLALPILPPREKKKKRKGKKPNQEDFFGSTKEFDVLGWRSKTADITYDPKKIGKILTSERRKPKGKTSIKRKSPPKARKIGLGESKIKLF